MFTLEHMYCKQCLEQIDSFNLNDGYTLCCDGRPIGAREAQDIHKQNKAEEE